jgi:hypothetical protein
MSNTLAIATVTATLQQLILTSISNDFPGATVTIGEPQPPAASPTPQVNICMYQISPNLGYANYDLPAKDSNGNWINQPTLGIDLHYLFTFYGNEQQLEPQRLLGDVINAMYTQPILTASLIEQTISQPLYSFLADSDLADSVEQVKLVPQADPREEVARLWRDYFQTIPYSLSLAYQASVVLITAQETLKPQIPVEVVVINTSAVPTPASSHIPLPPLHKASALDLSQLQVNNNSDITGTIRIGLASDESDIEQYRLYWSADGKSKLNNASAIKILAKTGSDLYYTLPASLTIPTGAEYLLVLTSNYNAEMAYGIAAPLQLVNVASGLILNLTKAGDNLIGGSITILKAADESQLTTYNIYWGSDTITKLSDSAMIASVAKTGSDIIYALDPAITRPANANYILIFAAVGATEMVYGVSAGIPPLNAATGISLDMIGLPGSEISGAITVDRAADESDISVYNLYWGSNATTKLTNTLAIASLAKSGNLTYTLPDSATLPTGASYVLAFTANAQAEMTNNVNAAIPPLYAAIGVTVSLSANADGAVSGVVDIIKALDETTLSEYHLYWSADGVTKLTANPFGVLTKNGLDQSYALSSVTLPANAAYVLVLTANAAVEMSNGVSAAIATLDSAAGVTLALTKAGDGLVGGSITILRAIDETDITQYDVYWSNDGVNKLALIATPTKTGSDITLNLSPPITRPANANYILVLTEGNGIETGNGVCAGIPPLNMASGVSENLSMDAAGVLTGTITVSRASDESDISDYNVYWSSDGQQKLSGSALIAALPKTGNLTYTLPNGATLPANASYILVLTENAQAEMTQGVNLVLSPLASASAVSLSNMMLDTNGKISGNINISPAVNESTITQYLIYWSSDGNNPLPDIDHPIVALPKTGNLDYALPPSDLPNNAAYILVLTANDNAVMSAGVNAILPPLVMATGVTLNLSKNANNQLSGNINIARATNESTISQYLIYWSADGVTPLNDPNTLIATLPKSASLNYLMPPTNLPANANYILVLTGNAGGVMTTGVSSAFAPVHKANAVQLNLTKSTGNNVGGNITILKASDESDITRYNLYWGADSVNKLVNTPFASPAKTGNDIVVSLSPPIPRPAGSTYVLSFSENNLAEMNSDTNAGIPPLNKALSLTLAVTKDANNQLTGTMTIYKSPDESDITYYSLYWGTDPSTKLPNSSAFKTLAKTGSDLIYQVTSSDNLIVPAGVTYVIVFTGNAQAEMTYGVGSALPS